MNFPWSPDRVRVGIRDRVGVAVRVRVRVRVRLLIELGAGALWHEMSAMRGKARERIVIDW